MAVLGERIKELRQEKGVSLRELAKYCDVSKSALGMYENGARCPKYETLEAIADFFNVDIQYLLGKSDIKRPISYVMKDGVLVEIIENPKYDVPQEKNNSPSEDDLSEGERMLLDLFRRVPEDKQALVLQMIRVALESIE